MKNFIVTLIALMSVFYFSACQKTLEFESDGVSQGTLKSDATGDCLPSSVVGIYKKDSALNATNFIEVQISVSVPGIYVIASDTINGYSFYKKDYTESGLINIRVPGSGTPLALGTNIFTINYGTSSCKLAVNVIDPSTPPAVYTFQSAGGNCSNTVVGGTYTVGTATDASNTLTASVNVTTAGYYTITTAAVSGVTFSASGVFATTGIQNVVLHANGVPATAGTQTGNLQANGASCNFTFTVAGGTPPPTGTAYTFNTTGTNCSGATTNGNYTQGAIANGNTVTLTANVTAVGPYTINIPAANGVSFSGSGTFTATGNQNIVLTATGTAVDAGAFNYTANNGASSSCTFSINYNQGEYVPMTTGTNYTERDNAVPTDTTNYLVIPQSWSFGGNSYKQFLLTAPAGTDTIKMRSSAGKYYQFMGDVGLDNPINKEYIVIDSTLALNGTWLSSLGMNAFQGTPVNVRMAGKIIAKGATATIAGNNYSQVIKVTNILQLDPGTGFQDVVTLTLWYAKGKGLIYTMVDQGGTVDEYDVIRIAVY